MSQAELILVPAPVPSALPEARPVAPSLSAALRDLGLLSGAEIEAATAEARRLGISLADLIRARGMVSRTALAEARARAGGAVTVDLVADPPDPRLVDRIGAAACLRLGVVPWRRVGAAVLIAGPDAESVRRLPFGPEPVIPVIAPREDIRTAILAVRGRELARAAETRVAPELSCRDWPVARVRNTALALGAGALAWAALAPLGFVTTLLVWSLLTMAALLTMKITAALLHLVLGPVRQPRIPQRPLRLSCRPTVSMLVPLYRETDIAGRLVTRLSRIVYPKELLEICLVVEADDAETRAALAATDLPPWYSVIVVPDGEPRTKPRALNYALAAARGEIVGVWDAEDAPEADQIDRIVNHFMARDRTVACLQGRLAYYNSRGSWLARCFSVEYATWFRIVLPGLARIGWPVPLGGTSVFFRRAVLEELGGWDAHNVTEDADLGLRLVRAGYRTELADTITYEEATSHLWPWVRQRSRWLKGYAITYAVHMRAPWRLMRDLGPWRFLGVQVLFLATLCQILLAPLLWSFWPAAFGFWHPFEAIVPDGLVDRLGMVFLSAEALAVAINVIAIWPKPDRHLLPLVPTMIAYFPFSTLACLKAFWELAHRPFFWDKTAHGADT